MAVTPMRRTERLRESIASFLSFFNGPYAALEGDPSVANFAVGNPHERPMPQYVEAIRASLEPQDKDWFAYKLSEPRARATVARTMSQLTGFDWDETDVQMTNGGFAALAVAFRTLLDEGDEGIYQSPPWFFYEHLMLASGGTPVKVPFDLPGCDLDVRAIEAAITPRTRVVVINSPHNPSGRIVPLDQLQQLAEMLTRAGERNGSPIYLISDEPYRRILFDGREFHSPAEVYPHTVVTYSYGKQLLAPGMRMGYITWPPTMPTADRERLRDDVFINQLASGWAFPNADLQHAIEEIEPMCIDLGALQRRRDRVVGALREAGYDATSPEATFYIMARSPIEDDVRFAELLSHRRVLVLPGSIVNAPGWFRVSLTASDEMVDRGLPAFEDAYREATTLSTVW